MARALKSLIDHHSYFCRGCGNPLPRGFHGHFHPGCLKADKRRRTSEKRRMEREKFEAWLAHQLCPQCGSAIRFRNGQQAQQVDEAGAPHAQWNDDPDPTSSLPGLCLANLRSPVFQCLIWRVSGVVAIRRQTGKAAAGGDDQFVRRRRSSRSAVEGSGRPETMAAGLSKTRARATSAPKRLETAERASDRIGLRCL